MTSPLTPEQKKRMEENRRLALERRAARMAEMKSTPRPALFPPNSSPSSSKPSNGIPNFFQNSSALSKPLPKYNKPFVTSNARSAGDSTDSRSWNVMTESLAGTCSLISKERFVIDVPYHRKVIEIFKSIPGKEYDTKTRRWTFPLTQYELVKDLLSPLSPEVVVGSLPKCIIKIFIKKEERATSPEDLKEINLSRIEPALLDSLFPFQRDGVRFGVSKGGRCLIADDMGLGKTLQAIALADYYKSDWPVLIVCPSSMRYQWEEEILKHLSWVSSYRVFVITNGKDTAETPQAVIMSYDLLGKMKEYLKKLKFGIIIVDECHSLKSPKTQRTKAALELIRTMKRCILLSGTPALSRPAELYTQIKALRPAFFTDMIEFGIRYCEGKQDKFGWNFQGACLLEELKVLLEETIMIRRLKTDVLDQLPSKMRQVIVLDSKSVKTDAKVMTAFAKRLSQDSLNGAQRRTTLISYFAETGKAKIPAICEYIEHLLDNNRKFLCFGHHKEVLDAISNTCEKKQAFYIRIDGSVSSEERKSVCDQFQEEDKFRVAVLSIKAANMGVTLTAAQLVVFAELFWNPGELTQAEDRAHRIGQKGSVQVQYLISRNTADDYIWPLVQSKLNTLKQAGLSKDNELSIENTKYQSKKQDTITNYFSMLDDEDVDDAALSQLMDEIEGVPEKKVKLDK